MELIRGLHNLRERHRGCVLSIGNFDGFHLGHRALVERLRAQAARTGLPSVVQVFEPTPREFFAPSAAPGRIATLRDKLRALEQAGADRVLCTRFGRALSRMPAAQFVEDVLVRRLGVQAVIVGDDFRFGAGRSGDLSVLLQMGERHGFAAEGLGAVMAGGRRISSTAVREALGAADLETAATLLGRPYVLTGRVRGGQRLGRKLGMPTANVALHRRMALRYGVYVVRARIAGQDFGGVASIGIRPSIAASPQLLEVHVFGLDRDVYGAVLETEFLHYLRPERRFDSLEALARQMQADGEQARAWLAQRASR
ncbi:MAG TPA: bifunctional riboflavin kinase/FAD synthetase [Candidatus Binatia bacterium]|nr:bifunctional riboflavin kinase/FAD synthetase [Candidatus Binatia bacterium]